jgi:hypothetical protein
VTAKDELGALAVLLILAAMLYLATWFFEGPPAQQDSLAVPIERAASPPGRMQS